MSYNGKKFQFSFCNKKNRVYGKREIRVYVFLIK